MDGRLQLAGSGKPEDGARDAVEATRAQADDASLLAFVASVPDPLMILDQDACIVLANASAAKVFGRSVEDLAGRPVSDLLPESIRRYHASRLRRRLVGGKASGIGPAELPGLRADGSIVPLEVSVGELRFGSQCRYTCIARDISHRKETERRLRETEERHALALRGANDGVFDWDLSANRIVFSPRWSSMLGLATDEVEGAPSTWFERVVAEDLPRLQSDLRAHLESRTGHFQNEHRMIHADGSVRWMLARGLAVWDADGAPVRIAGSQTDVTEQKLAQERLRFEVLHDQLTKLPNRAFFLDRLRQATARARRRPAPFSLLYVDLDHFKEVNDTHGHPAGDELLVEVSRRLASCLGPHDSAARLGGDEFVVLADGDRAAAEALAARIQSALRQPVAIGDHEVRPSASIGIACWTPEHVRPELIMKHADTALYRAKAAGKARHAVHEPGIDAPSDAAPIEDELRCALTGGQLRLAYQPVADLRSGRIVAFEALVRWQHPQRGELQPGDFLPEADAGSLAEPVAAWAIEQACEHLAHWRRSSGGLPSLAINVSVRQLLNGRCLDELDHALRMARLPAGRLSVEVSETQLPRDVEALGRALSSLRERGIGVTLDHFGSGWSSFRALKQLPFTMVKLDPSFLLGAASPAESAASLRTLGRLAEELGFTPVAVGVESSTHLELVRSLGFPYAQGHYLAPALPGEIAEELWYGARP